MLYEPISSIKEVSIAEFLIHDYIKNLEETFDVGAYDYTVHAHIHLPQQVINHGPLQCHSQFVFEVFIKNFYYHFASFCFCVNQLAQYPAF